jgi:hypothetical protein
MMRRQSKHSLEIMKSLNFIFIRIEREKAKASLGVALCVTLWVDGEGNQVSRTGPQHRQTGHKMIIDRNKILKYESMET